jgi:hypothetical protein
MALILLVLIVVFHTLVATFFWLLLVTRSIAWLCPLQTFTITFPIPVPFFIDTPFSTFKFIFLAFGCF